MKTYSRTPGAGRRQLLRKSTREAFYDKSPELIDASTTAGSSVSRKVVPDVSIEKRRGKVLRVQIERLSPTTIEALITPKPKQSTNKTTPPSKNSLVGTSSPRISSDSEPDLDESGYIDDCTNSFKTVRTRSAKKARLIAKKIPRKYLQSSPTTVSSPSPRESVLKNQGDLHCHKSDTEKTLDENELVSNVTRKGRISKDSDSNSDDSWLCESFSPRLSPSDGSSLPQERQTRWLRRSTAEKSDNKLNRSKRLQNKQKPSYEEISDMSSDDEIIVHKRSATRAKRIISDDSSFEQSNEPPIIESESEDNSSFEQSNDPSIVETESEDNSSSSYKPTTPMRRILFKRKLRSSDASQNLEEINSSKDDNNDETSHLAEENKLPSSVTEKISARRPIRSSPSKQTPTRRSNEIAKSTRIRSVINQSESNEVTAIKTSRVHNSTTKSTVDSRGNDWDPVQFLQCHSKNNSKSDDKTHVWHCSFEPVLTDGESYCVATCGGSTVCLIDCKSGVVLNRYTHPLETEEFFTMAWTTLTLNKNDRINTLAVAGRLGVIHLLHPEQLVCYAQLTGHNQMISALSFHPNDSTILCSGDAEGVLMIWDIGIPDGNEHRTEWRHLETLRTDSDVLSIAFISDFEYIIAGCADSCFGWTYPANKSRIIRKKPNVEFVHPNNQHSDEVDCTVDSIILLPKNVIASKCVGHKSIYLWNFEATISSTTTKLINGQRLDIQILAILTWSDSDNVYLKMGHVTESCILAAGDAKGKVWLYHLKKVLNTKRKTDHVITVVPPSITIDWPECEINGVETNSDNVVINCVALNSDASYIVSATNRNITCIWH